MSLFKVHMESGNNSMPGMPKWHYRQKRDCAWETVLSVPVMRRQFCYWRLSHQPCNPVEAPDWCFILLPGQGPLPISSQTLGCFSRHHLSMGRPERRNTRTTCCFSRSKGNRNRPEVAFPAFKKTEDGSSKLWIVTQGELWPGLSAVVMRQRSEDYMTSSNTWMIVFSIQTMGMIWPKSCHQRDRS